MFYNAGNSQPPDTQKYIRVPSLISEILPDGIFSVELPVGKFYFFAVKRKSGGKYGKPQLGDYWFRFREENSIALKQFTISEGELIDFGILEAFPWQGKMVKPLTENTTIEGTIRDMNGNPVNNGVVFGYPTPRMQGQRPLFVSNFTGIDGKYILRVVGDRIYYLMVRGVIGGGRLAVGEITGVYGENEPLGISVKTGETVGEKDIKVSKVTPRNPREEFEAGEK